MTYGVDARVAQPGVVCAMTEIRGVVLRANSSVTICARPVRAGSRYCVRLLLQSSALRLIFAVRNNAHGLICLQCSGAVGPGDDHRCCNANVKHTLLS